MPTKREILVRNLRLDRMADQLPDCVFPMQVAVQMDRGQARDSIFTDMNGRAIQQHDYPVTVRRPSDAPYIPRTVVWFSNPAEYPDSGEKQWTFREFTDRFADIEQAVETADPTGPERLYISAIRLVEVPQEYIQYNDDGTIRGVDHSIYSDRVRVAIAKFDKRPKIKDQEIREKLGTSLPGKVIKPLKLTNFKEVSLKNHRGSNETTADSTRRKYFSETQAEDYNNLALAPKSWDNAVWYQIEEFFPKLAESQFIDEIEFEGEYKDSETFVETDVRILSDDKDET